ncbi:MAG: hypothetical protein HQ519_11675 [Planctomycetes bacterium]|nr:hypothetical protein [Planctomycetota bacterium]
MLANFGDRLNPILVKEVRQAVRGKFFRFSFLFMLGVAFIVATMLLTKLNADAGDAVNDSGTIFYLGMSIVLAAAGMVLVPLHANRSMASERDDNTFDALLTSGLRPAQIIQGKWLAAGMLMLLFVSTLAPFLVVGHTLFGLDLLVSLLLVVFTIVFAMTLSLVAIFLACSFKNRALQSLALAFLAMVCVATVGWWSAGMMFVLFQPFISISSNDLLVTAATVFIGVNLLHLWGYGLAISTITHREENGLQRVRVACLLASLYGCGLVILFWHLSHDPDVVTIGTMMNYAICTGLNIPTLTESDHLGVRCRNQFTQGKWRRFGSWLFLPGGTSGSALYMLQMAVISLPLLIPGNSWLGMFGHSTTSIESHGLFAAISALVVFVPVALFPSMVASRASTGFALRSAMRAAIPAIIPLLGLLTGVLGLLFGLGRLEEFESGMNPLYVIGINYRRLREHAGLFGWGFVAALAVFIQLVLIKNYRSKLKILRRQQTSVPTPKPTDQD